MLANIEYVKNRMASLHEAGLDGEQIILKMDEEPEVVLNDGKGGLVILVADRKNKVLRMQNTSGLVLDETLLTSHVEFIIQQMAMMQINEVALNEKIKVLEEQVTHFQVNRLPNIPFTNAAYNADQRLAEHDFKDGHQSAPLEVMIGGYHHTGKTIVESILIEGLSKYGFNNIKRIDPEEPNVTLSEMLKGMTDRSAPEFFGKEIRINANLYPSVPSHAIRPFKLDPQQDKSNT